MKDTAIHSPSYCNSLTQYSRFVTRVVSVGEVPLGGIYPIRLQSMTTTNTLDTRKTVEQAIRMIHAGCEYVRITAPSKKEAENLFNIKSELLKQGYTIPIIADIHYTPNAAEIAARIVEKVRVNPGNYADKKKFQQIEYTDFSYKQELERIYERFTPLVKICKEYGTAMRIGTNHGSLSDRILSRYGDTPLGMVESALEFVKICEDNNYYDLVLSMKASNVQVMVQAYRLLVQSMQKNNQNYPLHLGVTEAGEGEDGRIKSAVGIGALLEDGIGDTIRVSLTEEPEFEIPVAKILADRYIDRSKHQPIYALNNPDLFSGDAENAHQDILFSPYNYKKIKSFAIKNIGGENVPRVIADVSDKQPTIKQLEQLGFSYSEKLDKWSFSDFASDYIYIGSQELNFEVPGSVGIIVDADAWSAKKTNTYPIFSLQNYLNTSQRSKQLNFISISISDITNRSYLSLKNDYSIIWVLETANSHGMAEQRRIFFEFIENSIKQPVIIKRTYNNLNKVDLTLFAATDTGTLMVDGLGDGIWLSANKVEKSDVNQCCFGILQATRTRISKTEYISCPSCGRTLFDLQETTAKIRNRTSHLKGVKIGIMGCIVNGPGEMADADYGYVGTGVGKITLYKGKEIVKRNISSEYAVDELIELIKSCDDWVEVGD